MSAYEELAAKDPMIAAMCELTRTPPRVVIATMREPVAAGETIEINLATGRVRKHVPVRGSSYDLVAYDEINFAFDRWIDALNETPPDPSWPRNAVNIAVAVLVVLVTALTLAAIR